MLLLVNSHSIGVYFTSVELLENEKNNQERINASEYPSQGPDCVPAVEVS